MMQVVRNRLMDATKTRTVLEGLAVDGWPGCTCSGASIGE